MIGLVTSCVVTQDEQGQLPEKSKEDMQSITGRSNDTDTHIGGASGENTEKVGRRAGSVQSIENSQFVLRSLRHNLIHKEGGGWNKTLGKLLKTSMVEKLP